MKKHELVSPIGQRDRYEDLREGFGVGAGGAIGLSIACSALGAWEKLHNNDPGEAGKYFVLGGVAGVGGVALLCLTVWANRKYEQLQGVMHAEWDLEVPVSPLSVVAVPNPYAIEADGQEVGIIEQPPLA